MRQVIYAWNYLEWGGAQIHLLAVIREARKEFDVVVVLPEGSNPQFIRFLEQEGVAYEFFRGHMSIAPETGLAGKIRRHLRKVRSEIAMVRHLGRKGLSGKVLHVDLSPQQSLAALAWLSIRTHVFVTSHNALPPVGALRGTLWRLKFRAISLFPRFHVFCSNEDAREFYRRHYSKGKGDAIRVTYTSVNPPALEAALGEDFDRGALRARFGIPEDAFVVLAVGQFIDRKGRWVFLEAAQRMAARFPDAAFVWVANSAPPAGDLERVAEFGLGERMRLITSDEVGPDREDLFRMFRLAEVFALPSYVEGLPISLLEAMALGIPSVSTRVFAIPEAVVDEETGLLTEPGDAAGLAEALIRLRRDPDLRSRLSRQGRRHVIERFDEREAARTAVAGYREALGLKHGE